MDGCRLDLPPRGLLLITRHEDRPGVLGQIGTLLGQHGVNIQRLELGPPVDGPDELHRGFLTLGSKPTLEVIEAIRGLDAIEEVQLLQL